MTSSFSYSVQALIEHEYPPCGMDVRSYSPPPVDHNDGARYLCPKEKYPPPKKRLLVSSENPSSLYIMIDVLSEYQPSFDHTG